MAGIISDWSGNNIILDYENNDRFLSSFVLTTAFAGNRYIVNLILHKYKKPYISVNNQTNRMISSNNIKSGGIVSCNIKVAGNAVPDELSVLSIYIEKKVNQITTAKIFILDGDSNTGNFDASSSVTFLPGAEVAIEAGYDSKNEIIFKGIITGQSISITESVGSVLEVECHDVAVKMTIGPKSNTFSLKKDSDIISSIIGSYPDLTCGITSTEIICPQQVQYYITDWDFILSRASANGLLVTTLNNKVSVIKPDADTSSVITIKFGDNLLEFNAGLNLITQLDNVRASAWDYKNQVVNSAGASNSLAGPGNLSSKKLSEVIGLSDYQLQTTAPLEQADLTIWSKAQMVKSEYSKIRGIAKFQGTSLVNPGKYITLQGLGDRFNGDHFVSGVIHNFAGGNWITEVSIGLSPIWFKEGPEVIATPAPSVLPRAHGLFNGTVKKIHDDPEAQLRILVDIPLFDLGEGIWARLSNFYSTSGAGAFFLPEVGDEVILGFLNEDPRFPVILGSMYSNSKLKPYEGLEPNEKNSIKAIVSKSGISLEFDDEKKVLTIATPGNNTVILNDEGKNIIINDQNQNSITMSADGITIKSAKNISFEAEQNITLKGNLGVAVQSAGGDVAVSGINIKEKAAIQYTLEGVATAEISSAGQITIKAAMVMIN